MITQLDRSPSQAIAALAAGSRENSGRRSSDRGQGEPTQTDEEQRLELHVPLGRQVTDLAGPNRDEEVVGSNPATPTQKHQLRSGFQTWKPALSLVSEHQRGRGFKPCRCREFNVTITEKHQIRAGRPTRNTRLSASSTALWENGRNLETETNAARLLLTPWTRHRGPWRNQALPLAVNGDSRSSGRVIHGHTKQGASVRRPPAVIPR